MDKKSFLERCADKLVRPRVWAGLGAVGIALAPVAIETNMATDQLQPKTGHSAEAQSQTTLEWLESTVAKTPGAAETLAVGDLTVITLALAGALGAVAGGRRESE